MPSNPEKTCRCCMSTTPPHYDMASTIIHNNRQGLSTSLIDEYTKFTNFNSPAEDQPMYFMACKRCKRRLEEMSSFREICRKSMEAFKTLKTMSPLEEIKAEPQTQLVEIPIKSEPESDEGDAENHLEVTNLDEVDSDHSDSPPPPVRKKETPAIKPKKTASKHLRSYKNVKEPISRSLLNNMKRNPSPDYEAEWHDNKDNNSSYMKADFVCLICDNLYTYFDAIQRHRSRRQCYNEKHLKNLRKCQFCDRELLGTGKYEEHLVDCHPEFRPQKCRLCPEQFVSHYVLKKHLDKHSYGEENKCFGCTSRYFPNGKQLRQHIQNFGHNLLDPNSDVKHSFNCPFCGLTIEKIGPLVQHITNVHYPKHRYRKYLPCFWCKRIFITESVFKTNVRELCKTRKQQADRQKEAIGEQPQFKCSDCATRFFEEDEMTCHQITAHTNFELRFPCADCDETFTSTKKMEKHHRATHPTIKLKKERKRHLCAECGKDFKDRPSLEIHIMDHTMEKPFKCDECAFETKTQMGLSGHKLKRHTADRVPDVECHFCQKKLANKTSVLSHLRRDHFPHLRKFRCNLCDRTFVQKSELKKHHVIHTGERKFRCTIPGCNNSYRRELGLVSHIQAKHTNLRYECRFCDAKFVSKKGIWEHAFKHRNYHPFNCPECSYGCYQKPVFKKHLIDKHGIEYSNAVHGNFEPVNEVIATCLKVSPEMEHFSEDKVTIKTNAKFMEDKAAEYFMRTNYQESTEPANAEVGYGFPLYFQGQ